MSKKRDKKERAKAAFDGNGRSVVRGYQALSAVGGQNGDWPLELIGEDSSVWQNIYTLRGRMRDLFKSNPYYIKYRELLWANVFGENGHMLRMKVKETEDRVVNAPQEKAAIRDYNERRQRVRHWLKSRHGRPVYRLFRTLARQNMIQVGDPDVFANMMIERRWQEWQRAENCDVRGRRDYGVLRQLRLLHAARDGDFFIRHVRAPKANKFGYSLQLINSEWCDHFYNATLPDEEIRMGIGYARESWGLGKPVAFYFIKRQPQDWQFSIPGAFNFAAGNLHERIPAEEIIHYARYSDADSTRPAPWGASTIPKARQLDQYELAEVIAAREAACKTGYLWSDLVPEGGIQDFVPPDPTRASVQDRVPGGQQGLPYGVKYQAVDPTHPSGNFENFRKGQLRSWCAGMVGADYNIIANDLEGINFSAGRLGRLDTNEMSKLVQRFDINTAERPIFEAWLQMSLITGAVPLPLAKFDKFNKPFFQGRRWSGVDEVKEATAAALRIANKMSSRGRECGENGDDFEEIAFELAEEEMLLESLGLSVELSVEGVKPPAPAADVADDGATSPDGEEPEPDNKPPKVATTDAEDEKSYQEDLSKHPSIKRLNGKPPKLTNGTHA